MAALPALSFASMSVHIGHLIEARRVAMGMSKTTLAARIHRDRSNLYKILEAPSIDTMLLREVCEVLDMNFFKVLSDDYERRHGSVAAEPPAPYAQSRPGSPLRVVIEVDSGDEAAQEAALRMAAEIARRTKKVISE